MPTRLPKESVNPDQDYRTTIQELIAARWIDVWKIAPQVLASDKPSSLHELRVASRRLRAAMDVGAACFPVAAFRPLHKIAKRITSATGELHDCDVQLKALRSSRKKSSKLERIGITCMVDSIESRRDNARAEMMRFLDKLVDDGSRKKTQRLFSTSGAGKRANPESFPVRLDPVSPGRYGGPSTVSSGKRVPELDPEAPLAVNARLILAALAAELFRHAWAIPNSFMVDELHEARLAAKRLRYTIELFPEVFGEEGRLVLDEIRVFQEVAGQVHDLDVRIQDIGNELRSGTRPGKRKGRELQAGLLDLLHRTQTLRDEQHEIVAASWRRVVDDRLEERLHELGRTHR